MSDGEPDPIEREPQAQAYYSAILLHGGGGSPEEFLPLLSFLQGPRAATRFILPGAPVQRVALFGNVAMRAWYNVLHDDLEREVDQAGIERSEQRLRELIEREESRGIPRERILLGGFSQGGAIALYTALRFPHRLAGVIALSSYLPPTEALHAGSCHCPGTPVYIGHGTDDELVPLALARKAARFAASHGCLVEFETFPMGHSTCPAEFDSIKNWLKRTLA